MALSSSPPDAFDAVAEPRRRRILDLLAKGERSVNDIAAVLRVRQPQASKHLRLLREAGLVSVRGEGQQRLYRLNAAGLKPIHDWAASFERFWAVQLDQLGEYLSDLLKEKTGEQPD
jgi:DNA-binding transcriptional ArsR family regulator